MAYWFGYRCVGLDGSNPGSKHLKGPFNSYENAKESKIGMRAKDMETTMIFEEPDEDSAKKALKAENFNRL